MTAPEQRLQINISTQTTRRLKLESQEFLVIRPTVHNYTLLTETAILEISNTLQTKLIQFMLLPYISICMNLVSGCLLMFIWLRSHSSILKTQCNQAFKWYLE